MTLPVPPTTLFKFARTLWFIGNVADVLRPHLFDYWQGLASSGDLVWMRFQVEVEDTTSTIDADNAVFKLDVVNYTGGAIDTSWTDADLDTVAGAISDDLLFVYKDHMSVGHTIKEMRAYRMTFAELPAVGAPDAMSVPRFLEAGPPVKTWPLAYAGVISTVLAPQTAFSVTLQTPVRDHWGRFYLPFPGATNLAPSGRIASSVVTAICGAVNTMYSTLVASEFYPVVPSTQEAKQRIAALQQVTGIRMDDVCDVIRRRRSKYANLRVTHDVATP